MLEATEMTYDVHYTLPGGTEDILRISGDSVEDIQEQAIAELAKRGLDVDTCHPWSVEVDDG